MKYDLWVREIPEGLNLTLPPGPGPAKSVNFRAWEYAVTSPRMITFLGEVELEWEEEEGEKLFHLIIEYTFLEVTVDDDLPPDADLPRVRQALGKAVKVNFA